MIAVLFEIMDGLRMIITLLDHWPKALSVAFFTFWDRVGSHHHLNATSEALKRQLSMVKIACVKAQPQLPKLHYYLRVICYCNIGQTICFQPVTMSWV